ncbi:MAG: hypothetical protein CML20_11285 [Rheinheimera sp.]|uniref:DUF3379 family protein n=1 Tax=Arsukibacterium sp. UBA3155 TaxID=1946058 RepID=UPI000C96553D|nr:DUF3379 family protein [Arsukibacterium sp. UBA3155]MAD75353.1 hypothetical protein [Rheinheimera sp.]|tara:strand:- start:172587 stop:173294 length:708 start_codon:yes stop_codon:yes gene_type:complete
MVDLSLRQALIADPQARSAKLAQAVAADPQLQQLQRQLLLDQVRIMQALTLDVPDTLAVKLLRQQMQLTQKTQTRRFTGAIALAASIAFVAGLTLNWFNYGFPDMTLGQHALAHVYHEAPYMDQMLAPQPLIQVNAKLASFGAELTDWSQSIVYSNFCDFRGTRSLHLVMQTEQGLATVFVVPADNQLKFEHNFSDGTYRGRSVALKNADLVVVSENEQDLQQLPAKLQQQLKFI